MFVIRDCEHVNAPIERCFQLSTHLGLMADTVEMKPVRRAGTKIEGLLNAGDRAVWYGWKFGMPHVHESKITTFDPPNIFRDKMERGRFRRFEQEYNFSVVGGHTLMVGYVRFSMPLGLAGRIVGRRLVLPHMIKLLRARLMLLKRIAENNEWQRYLPD
jgi:ligand-binding SRPBCC domain-containing protein